MADQAHIGSIDDIARFRAHLVTFVTGARVAVEECASDVSRQQSWLDLDRRKHWEGEVWRRQRKLEEARQSLFQESISSQRGPSSWHQMQVHRAEHALEDARDKLKLVRSWSRSFENRTLPMVKQVEQLHTVLTVDMARALNFLNQTVASLDAYASRQPAATRPAPPPDPTAVIPPSSDPPSSDLPSSELPSPDPRTSEPPTSGRSPAGSPAADPESAATSASAET